MNVLDIIFLIPLLYALYRGFKKGLIHMVSSLAALVLGIIGAIQLRPLFASALDSVFGISPEYVNVIAFAVAFVSIVIIVHLVAFLVEKLVTDLARIIITEFGVERVMVRVEKPGALRFAESVGVEIERTRADFA